MPSDDRTLLWTPSPLARSQSAGTPTPRLWRSSRPRCARRHRVLDAKPPANGEEGGSSTLDAIRSPVPATDRIKPCCGAPSGGAVSLRISVSQVPDIQGRFRRDPSRLPGGLHPLRRTSLSSPIAIATPVTARARFTGESGGRLEYRLELLRAQVMRQCQPLGQALPLPESRHRRRTRCRSQMHRRT